jgi:hypothetical protein
LEEVVEKIVRRNPAARLSELSLSNKTDIPLSDVEVLLVELCVGGVLEARFFWNCPNGHGVTDEAASVAELPDEIECDCGRLHYFDPDAIEVGFIPSQKLQTFLSGSSA